MTEHTRVEIPAHILALPADKMSWDIAHQEAFDKWFDGLPEDVAVKYPDPVSPAFRSAWETRVREKSTGEAVQREPLMQFFDYLHLPPHLQDISRPFGELAARLIHPTFGVPRNPERTVALRKLLEAKDCAVRAVLYSMSRPSVLNTHPSEMTMLADLRLMPYRERIRKASQEQFDAHPELFTPPKIYMASKAHHRPRWRELKEVRGFNIISRWIFTDDKFSADPAGLDFTKLWKECIEDVQACDTLIMYCEAGERLKGALVEMGAALAMNKEIIVTGELGDNGTWWHNNKVKVSNWSVEQVLAYTYGQEI